MMKEILPKGKTWKQKEKMHYKIGQINSAKRSLWCKNHALHLSETGK